MELAELLRSKEVVWGLNLVPKETNCFGSLKTQLNTYTVVTVFGNDVCKEEIFK